MAAKVIARQLESENKNVILIYNTFGDKDYKGVLSLLKPFIKKSFDDQM